MKKVKGFSLIEVIIAIGLMGFAGYAMMNMLSGQQRAIGEAERQVEELDVIQRMRMAFSDKSICTHTLVGVCSDVKFSSQRSCEESGKTWTDTAIANGASFTAIYGNRGRTESDIIFKVGQAFGSGAKQQVKLIDFKFSSGAINDGQTIGTIDLGLSRNKGKGNWVSATKKMTIMVTMGGGKVRECYSDHENMIKSAVQKSCENNGGSWDNNEGKCNLPELAEPFNYGSNSVASTKFVKDSIDVLKKTMVTLTTDENCSDGYYVNGITLNQGQLGIGCKKLPAPPEPLYGGSHTNVHCDALSNTEGVLEVDNLKLCKLGATSCPAGWQQYKFQHSGRECTGTTKSGTCWFQPKSCGGSTCTTSSSSGWTSSLQSGCVYHDGNWDVFCSCNNSGASYSCGLSTSYITKILCY